MSESQNKDDVQDYTSGSESNLFPSDADGMAVVPIKFSETGLPKDFSGLLPNGKKVEIVYKAYYPTRQNNTGGYPLVDESSNPFAGADEQSTIRPPQASSDFPEVPDIQFKKTYLRRYDSKD